MILDAYSCFDDNVAITATRVSTNVIDLLDRRDIGPGRSIPILILPTGTFSSAGGTATLTVAAQTSVDNITFTDAILSDALSITALNSAIGSPFVLATDWPRPKKGEALPRYLRLNYTVGTQNFTGGTIQAWLSPLGRDDLIGYPSGFTVAH
jgi:hypothetical protein